MDPLFSQASRLRKKGLSSLALVAGVLIGIGFYRYFLMLAPPVEPRSIAPRGEMTTDEQKTVSLFEQAAPSVVFIATKRRGYDFFNSPVEVERGSGSGFVWDTQGHVVTNFHVLQGGNSFEVILQDQTSYDASLVGYYEDKDLAVIKIDAPPDKLRPIPIGTTKDLKVGQSVFAIGNPFGLDQSLSTGVVSALNRTLTSVNNRKIDGMIQTDAAINPGNSGGPLLDSAGRLIGVNTQIYSTSGSSAGIGFALPSEIVNYVVPLLIRDGKVSRPGLGVYLEPTNPRITRYFRHKGVMIREVPDGGAADRAGLRGLVLRGNSVQELGDYIIKINDIPVGNHFDLQDALDHYKVGDTIKITFLRDREVHSTDLTLQPLD